MKALSSFQKNPPNLPSGYFLNEHSEFFQKVPINLIKLMGTFSKNSECSFKKYLLGNDWENCFKTHNELTMYPLGKCPFAPSVNTSWLSACILACAGSNAIGAQMEEPPSHIGSPNPGCTSATDGSGPSNPCPWGQAAPHRCAPVWRSVFRHPGSLLKDFGASRRVIRFTLFIHLHLHLVSASSLDPLSHRIRLWCPVVRYACIEMR